MSEQAVGTTPTEALVIEQGPKPPVITTESFNIAHRDGTWLYLN